MYTMIGTRPDLAYTVSTLRRFNANLSLEHAGVMKRTLRYLHHTQGHSLVYSGTYSSCELLGYSDSDWAGDPDTRRLTTGYVFIVAGAAISWKLCRQPSVAHSSTEAEYMAVTEATSEAIWLKRLLLNLGQIQLRIMHN